MLVTKQLTVPIGFQMNTNTMEDSGNRNVSIANILQNIFGNTLDKAFMYN